MRRTLILFGSAAIIVAACANETKEQKHEVGCVAGTVTGAVVGGLVGSMFGGGFGSDRHHHGGRGAWRCRRREAGMRIKEGEMKTILIAGAAALAFGGTAVSRRRR